MKAGLINHPNPSHRDAPLQQRVVLPLERLDAAHYNRRTWRRRLPAVIIASLLLVLVLLIAGVSLDGAPLLALLPLVCLPLAGAIALSGS
jgi:hypothetical protein